MAQEIHLGLDLLAYLDPCCSTSSFVEGATWLRSFHSCSNSIEGLEYSSPYVALLTGGSICSLQMFINGCLDIFLVYCCFSGEDTIINSFLDFMSELDHLFHCILCLITSSISSSKICPLVSRKVIKSFFSCLRMLMTTSFRFLSCSWHC
jgi:hypothetical protein